jgi:hypothetical protein
MLTKRGQKTVTQLKKERITAASPAKSMEDFRKAGNYHTLTGLYGFLKNNNAIIERGEITIRFPE